MPSCSIGSIRHSHDIPGDWQARLAVPSPRCNLVIDRQVKDIIDVVWKWS